MTNVSGYVKDMASKGPEMPCHHDESKRKARENLALVETVKENINEKFVNPFRSINKTDLLNIITGEKEISTNAKSKGMQAKKKAEENGADAIGHLS